MDLDVIIIKANNQINNKVKKYTLMEGSLIEKQINLCIRQKLKYIPLKL